MDFATARANMVASQLRTNGVTDPDVLTAMQKVPREFFLAESKQVLSYADCNVECGTGRFVMAPMVAGRLIQEAAIEPGDAVLCVGAGTGYLAAVAACLAGPVFALDNATGSAEHASRLFTELELDNAVAVEGPLAEGWKTDAPYDAILLAGMVPEVPGPLFDQLADEGRLVAITGTGGGLGRAILFCKHGGAVAHRCFMDATVPTLPEFRHDPGFVF